MEPDFLAWLAPQLARLEIDGQGRLRGRARLRGGELLAGTDLVVEASELELSLAIHSARVYDMSTYNPYLPPTALCLCSAVRRV